MEATAQPDPLPGRKLNTRIVTMRPEDLHPSPVNARFMRHEQFQVLVRNVRKDGALTSVPFVCLEPDGSYLILSGHHRVKAALAAGLDWIEVMVTGDRLTEEEKTAIQLSHNAIAGEDDLATLKRLYDSIEAVDARLYSGLDDKTLALLDQVQPLSISVSPLDTRVMTLAFFPDEIDRARRLATEILGMIRADEIWLFRLADYERWTNALDVVSNSHGIFSAATAFSVMLDLVERHVSDLADVWAARPEKDSLAVSLETIAGARTLPLPEAKKIRAAIELMRKNGTLAPNEKGWLALSRLANEYVRANTMETSA